MWASAPTGAVRSMAPRRRGGAARRPDVGITIIAHQGRPLDGPYGHRVGILCRDRPPVGRSQCGGCYNIRGPVMTGPYGCAANKTSPSAFAGGLVSFI